MKKAILFSVLIGGTGYLFAGNNPFKTRESRNSTFYVPHSDITDCAIHIESLIADTLYLAYERIGLSLPTGWAANMCDNANCYGDVREAGSMAPFKAPVEAYIKITVAPQGLAGTAVVQYAVWNMKAPTQRDTLTFNIVVNWGAGIQQLQHAAEPSVYPNPAGAEVYVFNPAEEPLQASLHSLDGRQLSPEQVVLPSRKAILPFGNLPSGVYLVTLKSATYRNTVRVVHP
jgi:hypothetical protein